MAARPGLSTLPAVQECLLKRSVEPHNGSFDFMLQDGLKKAIANLDPVTIELEDGKGVTCTFESSVSLRLFRLIAIAMSRGTIFAPYCELQRN